MPPGPRDGFGSIKKKGKSKSKDLTLEEFIANLESLTSSLPVSTAAVQQAAAESIAEYLRQFLRKGVPSSDSDLLSQLTIDYYAGLGVDQHRPLETLADHIIVEHGGPRAQIRDERGRFKPGRSPGAVFKPSVIRFEDEYAKIAYDLNKGFLIESVSPKVRARIFAIAAEAGFMPDRSDGGVWIIPARPFAHVLESREVKWMVMGAAESVLKMELEKLERARGKTFFEQEEDNLGIPSNEKAKMQSMTGIEELVGNLDDIVDETDYFDHIDF